MEEAFMNANVLVYKYKYIVIALVALIVYYLVKEKSRNMIVASVLASVVISYLLIEYYAKSQAEKQRQLLEQYSMNMTGAQDMMNDNSGIAQLAQDVYADIPAVQQKYIRIEDKMRDIGNYNVNNNNADITFGRNKIYGSNTPYINSPQTIPQEMAFRSVEDNYIPVPQYSAY